jgi:hypothetical protein
LDRRVTVGLGDSDPAITKLLPEAKVGTASSSKETPELLRATHRRSLMTATVAEAAKVERRLFVNALEVPI